MVFASSGALISAARERWRARARLAAIGPPAAVAGLALISLLGLSHRYDQMAGSAQMSGSVHAAVDIVEAARRPDEAVMLDRNLDKLWLDGGGDLWMALSYELDRRGAPLGDLPG